MPGGACDATESRWCDATARTARGEDHILRPGRSAGAESANTVAEFPGARAFATVEALIATLAVAPAYASVLVKGSRFMRMERVVAALTGEPAGDAHAA